MRQQIIAISKQYTSGLISEAEAADAISKARRSAEYNRDYSDHPDSYKRWDNIARFAETTRQQLNLIRVL